MLGATLANFPAFILLGVIIGIVFHFVVRRSKEFLGFGLFFYSILLSVLIYATSFWYELNHGNAELLEPIVVAYGPQTEQQKELMTYIAKAYEHGVSPDDIRQRFPNLKKYVNALNVEKYIALQLLWFCLTFAMVILVLGRRLLMGRVKMIPDILEHHFKVVFLIILSLQLMFPPVFTQMGETRSSMGYQFIFKKDGFVLIDLNLLIVQSVLVAILLTLLRTFFLKRNQNS